MCFSNRVNEIIKRAKKKKSNNVILYFNIKSHLWGCIVRWMIQCNVMKWAIWLEDSKRTKSGKIQKEWNILNEIIFVLFSASLNVVLLVPCNFQMDSFHSFYFYRLSWNDFLQEIVIYLNHLEHHKTHLFEFIKAKTTVS